MSRYNYGQGGTLMAGRSRPDVLLGESAVTTKTVTGPAHAICLVTMFFSLASTLLPVGDTCYHGLRKESRASGELSPKISAPLIT